MASTRYQLRAKDGRVTELVYHPAFTVFELLECGQALMGSGSTTAYQKGVQLIELAGKVTGQRIAESYLAMGNDRAERVFTQEGLADATLTNILQGRQ